MKTVRLTPWILPVAAFAAAFFGAMVRPVWHDELYTLALARLPISDLIQALRIDSGPPLHYLVCHLIFGAVGWAEGSPVGTLLVRLPSVFAFALIPRVVIRAKPDLGGRFSWGPLLAIAWLPLLYFGTEARAYALLALVHTTLWLLGPAWIERGGGRLAAFTLLAASLPLLHYTGLVSFALLPALALFIDRRFRRRLLRALGLAAIPTILWVPIMLGAPEESMNWVSMASGPGRPGLATVEVLAPAGPFPAFVGADPGVVPSGVSLAVLILLVAGAVAGMMDVSRRSTNDTGLKSTVQIGFGLLPWAILTVLGLGGIPVYFAGRTEAMIWAVAATVIAALSLQLPKALGTVSIGAYVAVGFLAIGVWLARLPSLPPAPGVSVGRKLAGEVVDGDRVVVAGLWQLEVRYGMAEASLRAPPGTAKLVEVETIPSTQSLHPGWLDRSALFSEDLLEEAVRLRHEAEAKGERIWLIRSPILPLDRNFFPAFVGWRRAQVFDSQLIAVDVLDPQPREAAPVDKVVY